MFDTYALGAVGPTRVSVNSRSEVHEHRAPTDDSVRLLREMEQRVRDEVVKTTIVRDTDFECVVYKTADLMMGIQSSRSSIPSAERSTGRNTARPPGTSWASTTWDAGYGTRWPATSPA